MRRTILLVVALIALVLPGLGVVAVTAPAQALPSACTALSDADVSFTAPPLLGTTPAGGSCWTLPVGEGGVVRVTDLTDLDGVTSPGFVARVVDASGQVRCTVQGVTDCTMSGTAPYALQVFSTDDPSGVSYDLQVARMTDAQGCAALPLAGFDQPVPTNGHTSLHAAEASCTRGQLAAGAYVVDLPDDWFSWQLRTSAGALLCARTGVAVCQIPSAGDFTLVTTRSPESYEAGEYLEEAGAMVALAASTAGCSTLDLSWATSTTVAAAGEPRVDCRELSAAVGESVLARTDPPANAEDDPDAGSVESLLVDSDGSPVCPAPTGPPRLGCTVGPHSGTIRLVSWWTVNRSSSQYGAYDVGVHSLSDPVGCPTLTPGSYGDTAATAVGNPCRSLAPTRTAPYVVRSTDVDQTLVTEDGTVVCTGDELCRLSAGDRYLVVLEGLTPDKAVSAQSLDAPGCVTLAAGPSGAWTGDASPGTAACAQLLYPAGSTITLAAPYDDTPVTRMVTVLDGSGNSLCEMSSAALDLSLGTCDLQGSGPFRALLDDQVVGPYRLAFARTDQPAGCAPLTTGAFGTSDGVDVTLGGAAFAQCFTLPDPSVAPRALISYLRTSGTGYADAEVIDSHSLLCGPRGASALDDCDLRTATGTASLLVTASGSGSYRLIRRSLGVACPVLPAAARRGGSVAGTVTSRIDIDCYSLAQQQGDRSLVDTYSALHNAGVEAYDPDGVKVCGPGPCIVDGASTLQLLVRRSEVVDENSDDGGPVSYQLAPYLFRTSAGLDPACARGATTSGFGPIRGVLDAAHAVVCVAVPENGGHYLVDLGATFVGTGLFGAGAASSGSACGPALDVQQLCEPGAILLTRRFGQPSRTYDVSGTCYRMKSCQPRAVESRTPPGVGGSARVGARLTGSDGTWSPSPEEPAGFDGGVDGYVYQWLRDGRPIAGATTRTLSLTPDLAGHRVSFRVTASRSGFGNGVATSAAHVIAQGPAPVVRTRPTATGVHRVGKTVPLSHGTWSPAPTSYHYSWTVGGKAISTTTATLHLTAAMRGKLVVGTVTTVKAGYAAGRSSAAAFKVGS